MPPKKETKSAHTVGGKKMFISKSTALLPDGSTVHMGEVAVEGAKILRTHAILFRPLEITHYA